MRASQTKKVDLPNRSRCSSYPTCHEMGGPSRLSRRRRLPSIPPSLSTAMLFLHLFFLLGPCLLVPPPHVLVVRHSRHVVGEMMAINHSPVFHPPKPAQPRNKQDFSIKTPCSWIYKLANIAIEGSFPYDAMADPQRGWSSSSSLLPPLSLLWRDLHESAVILVKPLGCLNT